MTVQITSSPDAFGNQSFTYSSNNFAADADLAPHLNISVGLDQKGAKDFTGLIAEVSGVSCKAAGQNFNLNFNDGGNPSSGFDLTAGNGHCFTTTDSIRLELTNSAGLAQGNGGSDDVWPMMSWKYDGWVRTFAVPYPGNPVIHDETTNADYTATEGHLDQTFANRRRFNWSVTLGSESQSQNVNEHPGSIKATLQEAWTVAEGEDVNDRRILLEDDKVWDAITLSRQSSVVIEPLNDAAGWTYTAGDGSVSVDANALKVSPTADDSEISKNVSHNLGTYRYLKVDLKADTSLMPIRITLGATYFWDVLVEAADVFETKTLDLAAPHNASSFEDVVAVQDISVIKFGALQSSVTCWFVNMRLERKDTDDSTPPQTFAHRDELRVLPPFQQDDILFYLCNGHPGLTEKFRESGLLLSIQDVITHINNRPDSGFTAEALDSGHPYYNPYAPAGFLKDLVPADENFTSPLTLTGQVRADRIIPWAGMGDPTQPLPNAGTLAVKFTKYLRGKVEGLVFIRDLSPPDKITTRIKVRKDSTDQDTQETDKLRYYRTATHLKAGTYEVIRIDESGVAWMRANRAVVNREVARHPLRAQILEDGTDNPVSDAIVLAEWFIEQISGEDYSYYERSTELTNNAGMYAVPCLDGSGWDFRVFTGDRSELQVNAASPVLTNIFDVAARLPLGGRIRGDIVEAGTTPPAGIGAASVFANETQHPERGWGVTDADAAGNYLLTGLNAPKAPVQTPYSVYGDASGFSINRRTNVNVSANQETGNQQIALSRTGAMTGRVTDNAGQPLPNAIVYAFQTDGLTVGFGVARTNVNGEYTITDLDASGAYIANAEADGFNKGTQTGVQVIPSASVPLNFSLTPTS